MRSRASRMGTAGLLAGVLMLAACATSEPTRLHTIEGVPAAARLDAYAGPLLVVRSVEVPPALDRPELVDDRGGGRLALREFDHWAAPLGRSARQALTEDLAWRLPAGKVVFPGAPRPAGAADVDVNVLAFKATGGTATMWLSWSLRAPHGTLAAGDGMPHPLQLQVPAGSDATGTAQAWSVLLGQVADGIVEQLSKTLP